MTNTTGVTVFHKSAVAYLYTALSTVVLAGFLGLVAATLSGGVKSFFVLLVLVVVARGLYRLAWLRSVSWTVTSDGLQIRRGLLPWRKWSWYNPWATLFEGWYRHGFFGFLLNYGTSGVTRGEGVTSKIAESRMHDAKRLTVLINDGIASHRQRMAPALATPAPAPPVAPPVAAPADPVSGLSEISRLLANGEITREEFDTLKARLIGS